MNTDGDGAGRPVRRILALALVAIAILLFGGWRHHAARPSGDIAGDEDAAGEAAHGWRRLFGGARPPAPLPTWTLAGHVVDGQGRPVPAASVHLAHPERVT